MSSLEPNMNGGVSVPSLDISKILDVVCESGAGTSQEPAALANGRGKKKKVKKVLKVQKGKSPATPPSQKKTKSKPKSSSTPRRDSPRTKKIKSATKSRVSTSSTPASPGRRVGNASPGRRVGSASPRASPRRRTPVGSPRRRSLGGSSSPRRLSIQNYSPRSRQSILLEEQNDRRILKTPSKKQWAFPSAAFASQSNRFADDRPQSPPPTQYDPQFDLPSARRLSYNASPFLTTSPRFIPPKSESPPHFDYDAAKQDQIPGLGAIALKSKSQRFPDPKDTVPPVGHYNILPQDQSPQRPSSPFKSASPRFIDPKPQTLDITSITKSSLEVKDIRNPSSVFASKSKRFPDPSSPSPGIPQDFSPPSSFSSQGSSKAPFGSTVDRFKIHGYGAINPVSPVDYSSQEISDFVYTPVKK